MNILLRNYIKKMIYVSIFFKTQGLYCWRKHKITEIFWAVHFTVLLLFLILFALICAVFFQQRKWLWLLYSQRIYRHMSQWSYHTGVPSHLWNCLQRAKGHWRLGSDKPQETAHKSQRRSCENQSFVTHAKMENHKEKKKLLS